MPLLQRKGRRWRRSIDSKLYSTHQLCHQHWRSFHWLHFQKLVDGEVGATPHFYGVSNSRGRKNNWERLKDFYRSRAVSLHLEPLRMTVLFPLAPSSVRALFSPKRSPWQHLGPIEGREVRDVCNIDVEESSQTGGD